MVFSSGVFLFLFLPVTIFIYFSPLCRSIKAKNIWLLFVSLGFYAWGEPLYIMLMLASIVMNWFLGRLVSNCPKSSKGKRIVVAACIYNLGVLFVFKYLSWLAGGFLGEGSLLSNLALPIGISFYTFQALSYVIDVYRGKEQAQSNVLNVGLYIAFFPQLIAGPIVRYGTISQQLKERKHSFDQFSAGAWRFVIGLSKKLLLANQLAILADVTFAREGSGLSVALAWGGALAFTLQLYFDFSGYSDMAIGLGKMFGFEFLENFNYPYVSTSISEFWRRWHISLGEWFRDYLYYPLSMGPAVKIRKFIYKKTDNRKLAANVAGFFVLFVVWMATGIWHGANWTFVIWGLLQFVCIYCEQCWNKSKKKKNLNPKLLKSIGFIYTVLIILCTKVIFKADNLGHALRFYSSMLHLNGNVVMDEYAVYWLSQFKLLLLAGTMLAFPVVEKLHSLCVGRKEKIYNIVSTAVLLCLFILDICYAVGGGYNPFIYFNF